MDPHSAPGLDGFPGLFLKSFWDIVGQDVVGFVRQFFVDSWLHPGANSNLITLIPKSHDADTVSQYRPIALANFIFLLIQKILADRLPSIVTRIISPQQNAFIKGRSIHDCIGLVSEHVQLLDRKAFGGNIGIKLDIHKAFDTLHWDFLLGVLKRFVFHSTFINWIKVLLHSANLSILINGSPYGYFSCSRGVRQGLESYPFLSC